MQKFQDNTLTQGLRKQLVLKLKAKGITDEAVLNAIDNVPRHYFLDSAFLNMAYEDVAFQIGAGQTISQPYTVAFQSQLLQIKPRDKVLEVGTGSGFQACVLAKMGAKVFSLERQKTLHEKTKKLIEALSISGIKMFYKDGFEGLPTFAPFDKMIITCAAPEIPETLLKQLKVGGILVLPLEDGDENQDMVRIMKTSETEFEREVFGKFAFVPMLKGKEVK